jgi:Flp pilus assembly protein protease CpaA
MSGIGAGDVKFLGGVGAYLGWKGVLVAFAYMAVFGGIYALILLALNRDFSILLMKRIKTTVKTIFLTRRSVSLKFQRSKKGPILCYGLPIGLGAFLRVFEKQTGNHLISWLQ